MFDKENTRQKYKEIRKGIVNRKAKESAIADKLFAEFGDSKTVFCYQSFGSEVCTEGIIREFIKRGATVFAPKVDGENMLLVNIETDEIRSAPCQLTIVPLLAFDGDCNRIGFGKGYYDRYLSVCKTTAAGIAFAEQYCEKLPRDGFDVPLSCIITQDKIVKRAR